jgi:hypothetical protein
MNYMMKSQFFRENLQECDFSIVEMVKFQVREDKKNE